MPTRSTLAAVLAVAAVALARPALAEDHHFGGGGGGSCDGCLIATGVIVIGSDLAYLAVGIPLLATGSGFGPFWSIAEMLWGTAQGLAGLIITPLGLLGIALGNNDGPFMATGILLIVVGAWLITHGIISMKRYFRRNTPAAPEPVPAAPVAPGAPPPPPPPPSSEPGEQRIEPEQTGLERWLPTLTTSVGPRGASVGLGWSF